MGECLQLGKSTKLSRFQKAVNLFRNFFSEIPNLVLSAQQKFTHQQLGFYCRTIAALMPPLGGHNQPRALTSQDRQRKLLQ
jgi:hypothetical protein